jgi:hypothetical protein
LPAAIRAISRTVPVLISETAVTPGGRTAAKIPGLSDGVKRMGMIGFVWFDIAQHQGPNHQNYRLEDNPPALAVFRREARNYP